MQRALAKNPEQRFGTCSEFAGALEFALGDSGQWEPGALGAAAANPERAAVLYEVDPPEEDKGWGKRLALLAGLCLAVGLAILLIVRMNSGPAVVTQVLDTRSGPASPPTIQELKYDKHVAAPPLDLSQAQNGSANTPTVVNVPVPKGPSKKSPAARQIKQVATSTEVQISTDPPGANVVVDGMSSCASPCSVTLAGGRHTLAATMDGYVTARKIFSVPGDSSILMILQKSVGVLLVSSEPSGASVNVDGRVVGTTPLTLRLSPGTHRVGVWDGSHWRDQSIQIAADEVDTRMFRF
jgi:hypothetical protein